MTIELDAEDWTWVTQRPCPDCGFDPASVRHREVADRLLDNASSWAAPLAGVEVRLRPSPTRWSVLEYACHVRDVHRLFAQRVGRMLAEDDPALEPWDQDEAAIRLRYAEEDPGDVTTELVAAATTAAACWNQVPDDALGRTGRRGATVFTIASMARYHLHDVVHHLWDVTGLGELR